MILVEIDRIKLLIKSNGIKIKSLCEALDVNPNYFNDVSKGKCSMSEDRLSKIADILGTTTDYLHGKTGEKNKPIKIGELSKDEIKFLEDYHSLPEDLQNQFRKSLEIFLEASRHRED